MNNHSKFVSLRREYPKFIYESYVWEWVDIESSEAAGKWALKMSFVFKVFDMTGSEAFVFEPSVLLSVSDNALSQIITSEPDSHCNSQIDILVFNCGMVEMVSYWKATCSPVTLVRCGVLTDEQQQWWKHLYFGGLGEFFYLNGIDADEEWFMRLQVATGEEWLAREVALNGGEGTWVNNKAGLSVLVPVGGGKDSCVTLELLKTGGISNITPFIINPRGATEKCCGRAGIPFDKIAIMYREIDPLLLELNKVVVDGIDGEKKFLNGHTPFSAMLAFYSTLAATLGGQRYIALSNESSANEATVSTNRMSGTGDNNGTNVNHQYSKSFEFESDFRYYAKTFLFGDDKYGAQQSSDIQQGDDAHVGYASDNDKHDAQQSGGIQQGDDAHVGNSVQIGNGAQQDYGKHHHPEYFSLLRPLSEIKIAEIFSHYPQYFDVFKSCNVGSKTDSWCGHCAKCLFVYIVLAPFLMPEVLQKIFSGKNLLNDISLKKELDELVGIADVKPFECVGTISEVNWALQQISTNCRVSLATYHGSLLDYYKTLAVSKTPQSSEKIFAINPHHALPPLFKKIVRLD
jgi:hypothetical protein